MMNQKRQMIIIGILFVLFAFLLSFFDVHELIHEWVYRYERFEIDELILLLPIFVLSICYFLFLKLKELKRANQNFQHEIIIRRAAEKKLQASEEKYKSLLESNPDPVVVYDNAGKVVYLNSAFTTLFGWRLDDYLSKKLDFFVPDENWTETQIMIDIVNAGKNFSGIESCRYNMAGDIIDVTISGAVHRDKAGNSIGCVVNLRDITEQNRTKGQLQQAQRMESIGVLAGGVAHDFNNILTIILWNADAILMDNGIEGSHRKNIEEIKQSANLAADLTRQLLAFSRKQIIRPEILNLNKRLTGITKMITRLIGEDIEMEVIPGDGLWNINIDPGQIEQVILNLVVNASDAMLTGGKLVIETTNMDLDRIFFKGHNIDHQPGPYVKLTISDNGIGMDKKIQEQIFEPFYTTKEKGKGTGLGLSTVYGIVKQNNGFIWIYSEPEQGSIFKIYLPKAKGDQTSSKKELPSATDIGGCETILLVEDNDALLKILQTALRNNGYKVMTARNGEMALEIGKTNKGPIDLIITDVVMPKMNGKETVEGLLLLFPHMKALYMSGYTDDVIVHHGILESGLNFIEKPFSWKDMAFKVRQILDKK